MCQRVGWLWLDKHVCGWVNEGKGVILDEEESEFIGKCAELMEAE